MTDADRAEEGGRWSHGFFVSFANTIAGGSVGDPAQHHRPARARPPAGLTREWTSRSPTSSSCCATPPASCSTRECPPSLVRAHIDDPRSSRTAVGAPPRVHRARRPGPARDLCLFLEETGAVAAPGPFLATALFPRSLDRSSDDDGRRSAVAGANGAWEPNDDPVKTFVLEADRVDRIAVVGAGPTPSVVDRRRPTTRCASSSTVDFSRRVFELDPTRSRRSTPQPIDAEAYAAWLDRAHVRRSRPRWSAPHAGSSTMALDYAKEREQFDVPIGSFQAIQHKLADMSLALERATAAVYYAAMSRRRRRRRPHAAPCTSPRRPPARRRRRIRKDGIQIHGGIGYTWEHDLHLYLRRATGDEYLLGTTGWHHDRLAALLIDD